MKKKILLTTDFSKNAWNAIVYILELYKNIECEFYVLNTFNAAGYINDSLIVPRSGEDTFKAAKIESEDGLIRVIRMITFLKKNNPKHTYNTMSMFGSFLDGVKKIIEEKDIELVIMGTKGESNALSVLFGSNAITIMEKVRNCPILVVPEVVDSIPPKEIVFPTSYKTHFKRRELSHLIEIANLSEASVRILHISQENELDDRQLKNRTLLEETFETIDYSHHLLGHMEISSAINCFVESRESDMVAFINKKHRFFGSILTQPLVKSISYYSRVPILVMHDLRN